MSRKPRNGPSGAAQLRGCNLRWDDDGHVARMEHQMLVEVVLVRRDEKPRTADDPRAVNTIEFSHFTALHHMFGPPRLNLPGTHNLVGQIDNMFLHCNYGAKYYHTLALLSCPTFICMSCFICCFTRHLFFHALSFQILDTSSFSFT